MMHSVSSPCLSTIQPIFSQNENLSKNPLKNAEACFYRVQHTKAPMILPEGGNLKDYLQVIQHDGPSCHSMLMPELESLNWQKIQNFKKDQPMVGIVVNELPRLFNDYLDHIIDFVRAQDCLPVLIPPMADILLEKDQEKRIDAISRLNQNFDALIGPGGQDISPSIYGSRNTHSIDTHRGRDEFESTLFTNAVLSGRIFVFGICRSHQMINALLGAKMTQDTEADHLVKSWRTQQMKMGLGMYDLYTIKATNGESLFEHRVHFEPGSLMHELGGRSLLTNSHHHQAILNTNYTKVSGKRRDPETGAEIIQSTEAENVLTMQFHPEMLLDKHEAFQNMLGTPCRRGRILFWLRSDPDKETTKTKMTAFKDIYGFTESDFGWLDRRKVG